MFILVDDETRENEGDLVIPAQMADAKAVNYMAKYGRGLICLSLDSEQVKKLGLPRMVHHNSSRHETAFTVSIEAREGVTTGISAADRAKTIAVATHEQSTAADIASPGHVFPLQARDGGVLVRAGHTEAAVDISRLAGLNPSGVICEIMNDDGTMARMGDLVEFAKEHELKIATIADLIEYRRRREKLVESVASKTINSKHGGEFQMYIYASKLEYAEHVVLVKGEIKQDKPNLVRMHAIDIFADVLGDLDSQKSGELQSAMQQISDAGSGVVVLLRPPRRDLLSAKINSSNTSDKSNKSKDLRDYGIGAQILLDLGIKDMTLLSNTQKQLVGLDGYGLNIVGYEKVGS